MSLTRTDEQLLVAWRDGEADAGSELLRRYFRPLYDFFSTKVDRNVDDMIQRTLLACVEARDRVRDAPNFRAFVYGVARHELFRHFRLARRKLDDDDPPSIADLGRSPSQHVARRIEVRLLGRAMAQIPVDLQIALELFYWEEMSGSEIAAVLEIPQGTIRTRLRRARQLLSERIAELAETPAEFESTMGSLSDWAQQLREQLPLVDEASSPP